MQAISLPFRIDGYGRVATTTSTSKIWADRARTVISTAVGERLMRPEFGCRLPDDVLGTLATTPELIDTQISQAFANWLPDLTYKGVTYYESDVSDGEVTVDVSYAIPTVQQDITAGFSFVISR